MSKDAPSGRGSPQPMAEPIAIIGIGCRFPAARGPAAFWELMRGGVDAVGEIPRNRFDIDFFHDPRPGTPGKIVTRQGGFLNDIDRFDPYFFGISPREAAVMDPQQRLLLEVAWETVEDAGQVPEQLEGSSTGVFVGACSTDYSRLMTDATEFDIYSSGGVAFSVLSGRVSYVLGLQGPSISIDTACSTSLVAVHLACQSLRTGESTMALAGGVNIILIPEPYMGFSRAGALSPDGRCKFGDARGNGFVRSEGAGMVLLKPISQAITDGDPIYAIIRGSAVNNDGRSGGLMMAPSGLGQAGAFRAAYQKTGISPSDVQYVEAHGTGTSVGDPIELESLGSVLGEGRPKDQPCIVGSVKTNIGHTEGAAGIAGLIKVALCLKHKEIPASLHFESPNPTLDWDKLPFVVPTELTPWPKARPALAAVNSFGISGTNAHLVLEESPLPLHTTQRKPPELGTPNLLALSAHTPEALKAVATAYQEFLSRGEEDVLFYDICYTAAARRQQHDYRLAIVANGAAQAVEYLAAFLAGGSRAGMTVGRRVLSDEPRVVFVFPGQGSQWLGMGKDLFLHEPIFREAIERCDLAIQRYGNWSLVDELNADEGSSRLDELDVIQPAIFGIQVALASLWRSLGVEPDAVVGHSMGEVAAAHVAGILSLDDASRIICRRSQLVRKRASGHGGMAVVELSGDALQVALTPFAGRICVASYNSPSTTVVAGEPTALQQLNEQMERDGTFFQMVKVDYASHSPHMDPLQDDLLALLEGINPEPPAVPMVSTVTVSPLAGIEADPSYWARNIRDPVCFLQAIEYLVRDGHQFFVEISPHPSLSLSLSQILAGQGKEGTVVPSMRREQDAREILLGSLGALHAHGFPLDWTQIYPAQGTCIPLPYFPWQRERFWLPEVTSNGRGFGNSAMKSPNAQGHPLLGRHTPLASPAGTHLWELDLSTRRFPYLNDHRVQEVPVLPATAFMEMALAAAREALGEGPYALENVRFQKALFLPDNTSQRVQLILSSQFPGETFFGFHQLEADAQEAHLLAHGTVRTSAQGDVSTDDTRTPDNIRARCPKTIAPDDLYRNADQAGIQYGPSFRGIANLWYNASESLGELSVTETVAVEGGRYVIHPALLDASLQVCAALLTKDNGGKLYLPVEVGRLCVYERPGNKLWSHARIESGNGDGIEASARIINEQGRIVAQVSGLQCKEIDGGLRQSVRDIANDLYTIGWEAQEIASGPPPEKDGTWILLTGDTNLGLKLGELFEGQGQNWVQVSPGQEFAKLSPRHYAANPDEKEDFHQLIRSVLDSELPPCRGVIHLCSLESATTDATTPEEIDKDQQRGCLSALHLVQGLAEAGFDQPPRLWLITRGTQVTDDVAALNISQAPLWGLGKVIALEHPELRCKRVDLDQDNGGEEAEKLFRELWSSDAEDQVALRGDKRYVPRLVRYVRAPQEELLVASRGNQPFSLEVPVPGILDNFRLRATLRRAPGPGEVEIQVKAAGVNFRDVMMSMGLLPPTLVAGGVSQNIGYECAGTIVSVGEGVEGLKMGDEVLTFAPQSFSSFVIASADLVYPKPVHLSFEEAATIPIVFVTAYYALIHIGRLRKGERVLIHAATGGVGMAAVQIAQTLGAEIFATAGSPEKRDFLHSLGIQHVMDSRSLDFAAQVMDDTQGDGIDMVLNSLAGEFISKGLSILRVGGRFLELGKIDILRNSPLGLGQLERNISFMTVDLSYYFFHKRDECRAILDQFMPYFQDQRLKPLPYRAYPISEASEAFRHIAQAKHIGKVVLSLPDADDDVVLAPRIEQQTELSGEATYLITGGLGGIGLEVAKWMVDRGARHLALMGRTSVRSPETEATLQSIRDRGAQIEICKADVADEEQMTRVLDEIKGTMPPLKGIVHGAAVLDDGILLQLDKERFRSVLAPKIHGAWNLHRLTQGAELDFFVLFSSVAAVLGSAGQANYVAGSSFLDALAYYRHALGLPAQVINWGAWAEVGLAAREDRAAHLRRQGIIPFSPAYGMALMEQILREPVTQMVGLSVDWSKLLSSYAPPLLRHLREEVEEGVDGTSSGAGKGIIRAEVLALALEERPGFLENFLRDQMARVLKCAPEKVDLHQPLNKLGIDSLMAVELKNRVENDLQVTLPVTTLLQGPSLSQLTAKLLTQVSEDIETSSPQIRRKETAAELLSKIDQLSDEEVDSLLRETADSTESQDRRD